MRRLALPALLLALALALVACGGTRTAQPTPPPGVSDTSVWSMSATGGPSADASVAPRPTATAAPTRGLTVENLQVKQEQNGQVTFTAQVLNLGTEESRVAKVVIELFDASGERVSRVSFASPGLPNLKPGEGTGWQGQRGGLGTDWVEARASVVAEPVAAAK